MMKDSKTWPKSRPIWRDRAIRMIVGFALLLTCLRVWVGPARLIDRAEAQIPDAGLQRKELLEEIRVANGLLVEIKHLLEKGTLNVRLEGADNQAAPPPTVRTPGK